MKNSDIKKETIGVIFGKFFPLHQGHLFMIDKAYGEVDKLVIFVCTDRERDLKLFLDSSLVLEPTPQDRVNWVKQATSLYPNVEVVHLQEDNLPKYPTGWTEWSSMVQKEFKRLGLNPDCVYTSEPQDIENYKTYLNLDGVLVDPDRIFINTSGTECRRNIFENFNYLASFLKSQFSVNIVIDHVYLRQQIEQYSDQILARIKAFSPFLNISHQTNYNGTDDLTQVNSYFTQTLAQEQNHSLVNYQPGQHIRKTIFEDYDRAVVEDYEQQDQPKYQLIEHIIANFCSHFAYKYDLNFATSNTNYTEYNVINGGKVNLSFDKNGLEVLEVSNLGKDQAHREFNKNLEFHKIEIPLRLNFVTNEQDFKYKGFPPNRKPEYDDDKKLISELETVTIDGQKHILNLRCLPYLQVDYKDFKELEYRLLRLILNFIYRMEYKIE